MELDDMKQTWKNTDESFKPQAYQLTELLKSKMNTPLDNLKKKYRNQLILLPIAVVILLVTLILKPELHYNLLIWMGIFTLLLITFNEYRNYNIVSKMQEVNGSLKQNLENYLKILEENSKAYLIAASVYLLFFIIVLEITMCYDQHQVYEGLHQINVGLRIVIYATAFILQPFISRYFFNIQYGQYIKHLRNLLDQTAVN